ncbi:TPA: hypothetical protein ACOEP6_003124 [Enterobacter ludwigii]
MNNVMNARDNAVNVSRAESEQGYILYFSPAAGGCHQFVKSEYPATVIAELSGGVYDHNLPAGIHLAAALWTGQHANDFTLSAGDNIAVWRWVVATVFVNTLVDRNGTIEVDDGHGGTEHTPVYVGSDGTAMNVFVSGVRLALSAQMEDVAYQRYPADIAQDMLIHSYREMITFESGVMALSAFGDNMLTLLHDHFLRTVHTEGIPSAPVEH